MQPALTSIPRGASWALGIQRGPGYFPWDSPGPTAEHGKATMSVVNIMADRGEDLKPALGPGQVPKHVTPDPHPELLSSLPRADAVAQPLPARGPQGPGGHPLLSAEAQGSLGEWWGSPGQREERWAKPSSCPWLVGPPGPGWGGLPSIGLHRA